MPGAPAQVIWGRGLGYGMARWRKPPGLSESAHPGVLLAQVEQVVHQGGKRVREDQDQKADGFLFGDAVTEADQPQQDVDGD